METLHISDSAASRINHLLSSEGENRAFRVTVEGGGCSGFQYKFDFTNIMPDDIRFDKNGARIVTDSTSLGLLNGSTVDFIEELGGAYFAMKNPNAASSCGCGSSFAV